MAMNGQTQKGSVKNNSWSYCYWAQLWQNTPLEYLHIPTVKFWVKPIWGAIHQAYREL